MKNPVLVRQYIVLDTDKIQTTINNVDARESLFERMKSLKINHPKSIVCVAAWLYNEETDKIKPVLGFKPYAVTVSESSGSYEF